MNRRRWPDTAHSITSVSTEGTDWELLPDCLTLCCGESLHRKQPETNHNAATPLPPPVLCQHIVQTCCIIGFKISSLCSTRLLPKSPPHLDDWRRLNPQPGHLTACLLVTQIILIISQFIPSSTSSRHVRLTIRQSVFLFCPLSPLHAPDYLGAGEKKKKKSTKGGDGDTARQV